MSQESLTFIREWVSTWAGPELIALASDPEQMAPWFEALHPDFEGSWARELAGGKIYHGIEGAQRMAME